MSGYEVQAVETVYDERAAEASGLRPGLICSMVHCGSRGPGRQICSDHVRTMVSVMDRATTSACRTHSWPAPGGLTGGPSLSRRDGCGRQPAYKDVDDVVRACQQARLADLVVRLVPVGVVKG
jgi:RNA-splicing ligase RtcB